MTQTSRLVVEIDSRDAEQRAVDTRKALEALESAGLRVKPSMEKAGAGLESAGKSADKTAKSFTAERSEIEALLGRIDPLRKKQTELAKTQAELAAAFKNGDIGESAYKQFSGIIREQATAINTQRAALTGLSGDLSKTGMSAKATAVALRGVPAQVTDIFTSIAAGQPITMVALQQGGQLKDMLGGIGPAAKALGGYIAGLVNPLTVAAAAVGGLAAVYYDAEKEVSAFNKALFSGSASSGQTTSTLSSIAKDAASITGSLSESRAAVIALAASTGLSQVQFRNLAEAATAIGEFTGKSAGEVASSLGSMGKSATDAAEKISAQYGLLTSAQYDVIRGLDDQGKKQEALDYLGETLNQNAQARFKRYRESLSDIERDWGDIGTAISNAYSNVKSSLFPDINQEIANLEKILEGRKSGGFLSNFFSDELGPDSQSTKFIEAQLKSLKQQRDAATSKAEADAVANRQNQDRIAAESKWNSLSKKELSDQAKLVNDIADARKLGVEAGRSQAEIDKVVADIQAKFDKSQAKPKAYTEDAGTKELDKARQQYAVLMQQNSMIGLQGDGTQKLGAAQQDLIRWEQELADIKTKQTLTADQKSLLAKADQITAAKKLSAEQEKLNDLKKAQLESDTKLLAFQENLNSQLNLAQSGLNEKLAGAGLGDKSLQRLQEQQQIRQSYQQQMDRLTYDYNKSDKSADKTDLYNKETAMLEAALQKRLTAQTNYYAAVDQQQSDWSIGASSAFQNYAEQAADVAGQTRNLFTNAFSNMEDGIVDFVKTGKLSFKDLADGIISDLIRIQVRQAAVGIFGSLIGGFGGGASASGSGTMTGFSETISNTGFSSGGYTGDGGKFEPKGVVHGGEFVVRKDVVSQPGAREFLERMNSNSKGYADGGYVGSTAAASTSAAQGGASGGISLPSVIQHITVGSNVDAATAADVKRGAEEGAKAAYQAVLADLKRNGPISQLISRKR